MIHLAVPIQRSGGVFDFATRLGEALGTTAQVVHLSRKTVRDWKIAPGDDVVLQMSGYGFQKRGAPLWLLDELRARRGEIRKLGVFFHELYAFGPLWSSSFWLSPVQRHIARQLAKLSDFWLTSREESARWLLLADPLKPHEVLPVFSNVGESDKAAKPPSRRVAVFGGPGLRLATYRAAGPKLFEWARSCQLEVHDVGSALPDAEMSRQLAAQGAVMHGCLNEAQVGHVMRKSDFGLLAYPVEYVAKSGVFASYCAHGACPILISDNYRQTDGLTPGVQYIAGIPADGTARDLHARIGQAAWDWYQPHQLQRHVDVLRRLLDVARRS
jgi:hypothetical protein